MKRAQSDKFHQKPRYMRYFRFAATVIAFYLILPSGLCQQTPVQPTSVQLKARAYLEKAVKELPNITDEQENYDAMHWLVLAQAQAGDLPAALQTVAHMKKVLKTEETKTLCLNYGMRALAYAQATTGDLAGALERAQECAKINGKTGKDNQVISYIAKAQARAGDIPAALRTVETIDDTRVKNFAWLNVVKAQREAGDTTGAERTAENIKDENIKRSALGIGFQKGTYKIPEEAEVKAFPKAYSRCKGYINLANEALIPITQ
jgi:hypothetical protein